MFIVHSSHSKFTAAYNRIHALLTYVLVLFYYPSWNRERERDSINPEKPYSIQNTHDLFHILNNNMQKSTNKIDKLLGFDYCKLRK